MCVGVGEGLEGMKFNIFKMRDSVLSTTSRILLERLCAERERSMSNFVSIDALREESGEVKFCRRKELKKGSRHHLLIPISQDSHG